MLTISTGIPLIVYEAYVLNGKLTLAAFEIDYLEPTPENYANFMLPSAGTPYGTASYSFFEKNVKAAVQDRQKILKFTSELLAQSLAGIKSITAQSISEVEAKALEAYEKFGLPATEVLDETPLAPETKKGVAAQFAVHSITERVSQPIRKIVSVYGLVQDHDTKQELQKMIGEYCTTYNEILNGSLDHMPPLAVRTVKQFRNSLKALNQS